MNRTLRVSFGVIGWGVVATFAAKGLGFISTAIQARLLGPQGFGQYGAILTTISLFGVAASASLGAASSTLVAFDRSISPEKSNETISTILILFAICSLITGLVFVLFSPMIALYMAADPRFGRILQLGALALVVTAASGVVEGLLAGLHKFQIRNNMPLVQGGIFLISAASLTSSFGVAGAVWAYTISSVASVTYATVPLFRGDDGINWHSLCWPSASSFKRVALFLLPLIGNNFLVIIANWWITLWIARGPAGFSDLGLFTLAVQLRLVVLIAPFVILNTYSPLISSLIGSKENERVKATISLCIRATLALATLSSIAIVVGLPLLFFFVGNKYAGSVPIVVLGSVNAVLMAMCNFVGALLIVCRRENETIIANLAFAAVILISMPILCRSYGATGAMMGSILGQIVQFVCILLLHKRIAYRVRSGSITFLAAGAVFVIGMLSVVHLWQAKVIQVILFLFIGILTIANAPEEIINIHPFLANVARKSRLFRFDVLCRTVLK